MFRRSILLISLAVFGSALLLAQPERISMETPSGWKVPRTSNGVPDLQGVWTNATVTPLQRPQGVTKPFFTEEEARAYEIEQVQRNNADIRSDNPQRDVSTAYNAFWYDRGNTVVPTLRTSLIIDPENGQLPDKKPDAPRMARRGFGAPPEGPEDRSLAERCIVWPNGGPPLMPSFYNNNYQIVQGKDWVAIESEMIHDVRVVPTDGRGHVSSKIRNWMGDSIGHWDGDTLVVETTNFRPETAFQGTTKDMKLTERFRRVNDDVLLYEFTVDDPSVYVKPWTVQIPMTPAEGQIFEYACNEGNYAMEGMLRAAREEELKESEGKK